MHLNKDAYSDSETRKPPVKKEENAARCIYECVLVAFFFCVQFMLHYSSLPQIRSSNVVGSTYQLSKFPDVMLSGDKRRPIVAVHVANEDAERGGMNP